MVPTSLSQLGGNSYCALTWNIRERRGRKPSTARKKKHLTSVYWPTGMKYGTGTFLLILRFKENKHIPIIKKLIQSLRVCMEWERLFSHCFKFSFFKEFLLEPSTIVKRPKLKYDVNCRISLLHLDSLVHLFLKSGHFNRLKGVPIVFPLASLLN